MQQDETTVCPHCGGNLSPKDRAAQKCSRCGTTW
jgi:tRNA(Ile2) C34 agmatinyltransferase TiaS